MTDLEQQRALLRYVIEGNQGSDLAAEIVRRRPSWLPATSQALREGPLAVGWGGEDFGRLCSLLYPAENTKLWSGLSPGIHSDEIHPPAEASGGNSPGAGRAPRP